MKYVQISHSSGGWAVEIVFGKHIELMHEGVDSYVFWGAGKPSVNDHEQKIASEYERMLDKIQTRIDGKIGFHSKSSTRRLIDELDKIQPDVVHLHSPLGYYLNVEMFFKWLSHSNCKFYWTMHDCWAFTGYCMHFTLAKCDQWKTGCTQNCPCPPRGNKIPDLGLKRRVAWNYQKKKELFTSIQADRVTIITPSEWLAKLVKQSFLGKYEVEVRNNTINTDVFKPTTSSFRKDHGLQDKYIVLGVSSHWGYRKGIQDFARLLDDLKNKNCAVVMVGLNDKEIEEFKRKNVNDVMFVGMKRTASREELAAIYSAADVFFNPTLEENYPTVNLESEACGTPVVTYDTGGCRETIHMLDSVAVNSYEDALNTFDSLMMKRKDRGVDR